MANPEFENRLFSVHVIGPYELRRSSSSIAKRLARTYFQGKTNEQSIAFFGSIVNKVADSINSENPESYIDRHFAMGNQGIRKLFDEIDILNGEQSTSQIVFPGQHNHQAQAEVAVDQTQATESQ